MTKQSRLRVQGVKRGRRIILLALLLVVAGAAGWYLERQYQLITSCRETLASLAGRRVPGVPRRGEFYDRNLKQIAINRERVSVYVRTQEINSIAETVMELAPILSLDEETLKGRLESGALRVWVAEDISQDQEISLKAKRIPGVHMQREEKRVYPNGPQAAHLIGYVDNGIGLAGVEYYYDRMMASGAAKGKPLASASRDLVLTLDLKIQEVLEGLVQEVKTHRRANRVLAYLMDSGTGAIIGGAQLPGFDPNNFTRYPRETLDNQFVNPLLLPEKFRIFLRDAAILESEADGSKDAVPWCLRPGENSLGNQVQLWEWLGLHEKTITDFRSSTTEPEEMVPGDQRPLRSSPPSLGMVPEQTTPLKLMSAFAVLLHNGHRIRPFVVHKRLDLETGVEMPLGGEASDPAGTSDSPALSFPGVRALFASQAREGAGGSLFFDDRILAGEPAGKWRKIEVDEILLVTIPAGDSEMTLLVAAAGDPLGPRPRNAIVERSLEEMVEERVERLVVLQEVAKTVADVVEPELPDDGNYQRQIRNSGRTNVHENRQRGVQEKSVMPDLRGLSLRKSLRLLQGIHVKISIRGTGRVVTQQPSPGAMLAGGAECTLVLEDSDKMTLEKLSKHALEKQPIENGSMR